MAPTSDNYHKIVRMDALTGVGNQVGFYEWLLTPKQEEQFTPFSLMSTEVRDLKKLNQQGGRDAGDTALVGCQHDQREHKPKDLPDGE